MAIRTCIKAVIIQEGKILLNRGDWLYFKDYYDFPGGGQRQYETVEDALRREVLEETGLSVRPLRLCAVKEEIFTKPGIRKAYPHHSHRLNLFYLAQIEDVPRQSPTHVDSGSQGASWYPLEDLETMKEKLFPEGFVEALPRILKGEVAELQPTYYEKELE